MAGLVGRAADNLPGARQLILDVLGTQVEHAQLVLGGVPGGLRGIFHLLPGGFRTGTLW